jgi:hypothetical protein
VPFERSRQQWREISLEKKLAMFVAPVVVAVVTAVVVPQVLDLTGGDDGGGGSTTATGARDEVLEVVDLGATSDPDPPAVDVSVRNIGDTVSVVTGVVLRVRDFELIGPCVQGAALEPSAAYDVELPADPEKGDRVDARLSQQIPAGTADRFLLRMQVPQLKAAQGSRLYALDVALQHDGVAEALHAGTAIVAVPHLPSESFFPGNLPEGAEEIPGSSDCAEKNLADYERFLELDAVRPPEMTAALAGQ